MMPKRSRTRRFHTVLTKLTLAALVFTTLAYASEFSLLGLDREIGIVVGCLALASVLVATGWRWTPVVGTLLAGGILIGNPWLLRNLSLPVTSGFFSAATQVVCRLVVVGTGVGAIRTTGRDVDVTCRATWGRKRRPVTACYLGCQRVK